MSYDHKAHSESMETEIKIERTTEQESLGRCVPQRGALEGREDSHGDRADYSSSEAFGRYSAHTSDEKTRPASTA